MSSNASTPDSLETAPQRRKPKVARRVSTDQGAAARDSGPRMPGTSIRFDTRLIIESGELTRTPAPVLRQIEPVLSLIDGRTVAAVLADSPLPPALTLRVLERLVSSGAAKAGASAPPVENDRAPSSPGPAATAEPPAGLPAPLDPPLTASLPARAEAAAREIETARIRPADLAEGGAAIPRVIVDPVLLAAAPSEAQPAPGRPASSFSDLEEDFFATEPPEIREARLAREQARAVPTSGTFRPPQRRGLSLGGILTAALGWFAR